MRKEADIFAAIDELIDRWRERRAPKPLRIVLPVSPPTNFLAYGAHTLYGALRDVPAVCKDEPGAGGLERVGGVSVALQRGLENL